MSTLTVMVCRFQRRDGSPVEQGLIIQGTSVIIIDMQGKLVPVPVWDYITQAALGTMVYVEDTR